MDSFSRRNLLKSAGLAGAAAALPVRASAAQSNGDQGSATNSGAASNSPDALGSFLFFFNTEEARFVEAAVDRLIPADDKWGGAKQAGVLYFIDRQLASGYGAGAQMYLDGPWDPNAPPQQGYQLRYSPKELYRTAIGEVRAAVRDAHNKQEFWDLSPDVMDQVLSGLEHGQIELKSVPSPVFFETLLANTIEGYFADPAYGGNRDMIAWKMIGFPGAYAQYVGLVDKYDLHYTREPLSLAGVAAEAAAANDIQHKS